MTFPQLLFLQDQLFKIINAENGKNEKGEDIGGEKEKANMQTEALAFQVRRLQFLSGKLEINIDDVYNPQEFIKREKISPEKIKEWEELVKEERKNTDKFGRKKVKKVE